MREALTNLKKILNLELSQGCQNKAMVGGLSGYAPYWVQQNSPLATTPEEKNLLKEVEAALLPYDKLDLEQRRQTIDSIFSRLNEAQGITSRQASPSSAAPAITNAPRQIPGPAVIKKPTVVDTVEQTLKGLKAPVTRLPGIKEGFAKKLAQLGVSTIGDLLELYPRRYNDYSHLKTINELFYGETVTIIGQVLDIHTRETGRRGLKITSSTISDGTASIQVSWFNQPWIEKGVRPGSQIAVSGKIDEFMGRLAINSPEYEILDDEFKDVASIRPVYPLTEGINQKWLRQVISRAVDSWADRLPEHLSDDILKRWDLMPLGRAVRQIHRPDDFQTLDTARYRLTFDELLLLQLGIVRQRIAWQRQETRPIAIHRQLLDDFIKSLPYTLTSAQEKVITQIIADVQQTRPMSRLLQGDVGSGKTVVALAAMLLAVADGGQAAIMAPTEILAEQHYRTISRLLAEAGEQFRDLKVQHLSGSTGAAQKAEVYRQLAEGECHMAIGTHALIQNTVTFKDLRLAVIDEQHRFGVGQRAALREKGFNPHILVMSATPIPRSLALTVYGDLDISVIDIMPPGRKKITTRVLPAHQREKGYEFIFSCIGKGQQAFIICPLVEESDKIEAKAAVEEYHRLQAHVFPDLKLGLLHGRLKSDEKDAVMSAFRNREYDILVTTSVVEVGIDIPNATVMLVEGANRFGLAQLHQFRGRVGRGQEQSYCLLVSDSDSPEAMERLKIVETTDDGFRLAEEDLRLRGPGEFFGARQSGAPDMKLVRLTDTRLLERAREEAQHILAEDAELSAPKHRLLAWRVRDFWNVGTDLS